MSLEAGFAGTAFGTLSFGIGSTACSTITPLPSTINVPTNGYVRYSCTVTTGATSTYAYIDSTSATSSTFYIDAVQISGGSNALQYNIGSIQLRGVINSPVTIQPFSNSTSTFQIQNAAGTSNLFVADTLDGLIDLGGNVLLTQSTNNIGTGTSSTIQLGSTSVANTIQIGGVGGAVADTVSINTAAAAETTTVGSLTTTSATTINGGTVSGAIYLDAAAAGTIVIGNTTASTANTIQIGSVGSANIDTVQINTGAAAETTTVGSLTTTSATTINGGTSTTAILLAAGASGTITIGSSSSTTANSVNIGAVTGTGADTVQINTAAAIETTKIGSTTTTSATTINGGALSSTATNGVIIGYGYSSAANSLISLTLSGTSTYGETTSYCSTILNEGAMYYNSATNSQSIRSCINGNWDDLISTSGLGMFMYGVLQDSGSNPGDVISAITAGTSGPCKVSWATATSVSVAPCTAYSSGRKVVVPSATSITGLSTAGDWYHICFNGSNNALTANTATTETNSMPTFSTSAPVLCLADVVNTGGSISAIYDTRVFATSEKEEVTTAAAMGLGWIACPSGNQVNTCGTTTQAADTVEGIIAISNNSTSTTTPNAIMVVSGPAETKVNLTGITAGQILVNSTTANRVTSVATGSLSATYDANLGITRSASPATACTSTASAADCDYQGFVVLDLR
jgi:acrosin